MKDSTFNLLNEIANIASGKESASIEKGMQIIQQGMKQIEDAYKVQEENAFTNKGQIKNKKVVRKYSKYQGNQQDSEQVNKQDNKQSNKQGNKQGNYNEKQAIRHDHEKKEQKALTYKGISYERLQDGMILSEILGPPVSKKRRNRMGRV